MYYFYVQYHFMSILYKKTRLEGRPLGWLEVANALFRPKVSSIKIRIELVLFKLKTADGIGLRNIETWQDNLSISTAHISWPQAEYR